MAESLAHRRVRIGNVEPALASILRQLDPLIVMLALFGCELLYRDQFTPALGAYGTLLFILTRPVFQNMESLQAGQSFSDFSRTYGRIVLHWGSVVAIVLLGAFALKLTGTLSRRVLFSWFAVTPVLLSAAHALRLRSHWTAAHGKSAPSYIIIGVNDVGFELARRLPVDGFKGYFDFRSIDRLSPKLDPEKLTGHCKDVADFVRAQGIEVVYIALPLSNVPRMHDLMNALRDTTASVYFIPDAFAFDVIQARLVEINGMPALSVCDTPLHGLDAVLKRALDILFAGAGLALISPFMIAVTLAVKLTSKGPAIFRQRRYGLKGEEIIVYKFRSMTVTDDGAVVRQATRTDARITPVGRFIRRTSIDELPQLINVLQGRMSLVGPRPHAVAHNETYRKLISGYMIRHKVRPGITGLAQVNGLRGETETLDKMSERVRFDLEYLRHWSPWLDIKILFQTVAMVIRGDKNVY